MRKLVMLQLAHAKSRQLQPSWWRNAQCSNNAQYDKRKAPGCSWICEVHAGVSETKRIKPRIWWDAALSSGNLRMVNAAILTKVVCDYVVERAADWRWWVIDVWLTTANQLNGIWPPSSITNTQWLDFTEHCRELTRSELMCIVFLVLFSFHIRFFNWFRFSALRIFPMIEFLLPSWIDACDCHFTTLGFWHEFNWQIIWHFFSSS